MNDTSGSGSSLGTLLSSTPESLRKSLLSKFWKLQGLKEMMMAADMERVLSHDRQIVRAVDKHLLGEDGTMPEEEPGTNILADNITIGKESKNGTALQKLAILAGMVGTGLGGFGLASYLLKNGADTDTTHITTIRFEDEEP
jgi:hypothetical protein